MKICLVGLDNLPVLAPEFRHGAVGGEPVQQTLLARALARRGYDVSMVVGDHGQPDGAPWEGIRTWKAYRRDAGVPVLRFVHPRWTGVWAALARADADVYYTSCAGMQAGLVALFCRRHGRRFVFRTASDPDCDRSRVHLLVPYARDRWLYEYGLRHADAILVQSASQAQALSASYGLTGQVAGMLVERPRALTVRDIDVLWVGNVRREKRPDRLVELAASLPGFSFHMAGGPLSGTHDLYRDTERRIAALPNAVFHGPLPYQDANALYDRARLLVNTSDFEGFPNTYLQSWVRGVPVVTLIDPDGVIEREGLGAALRSPDEFAAAIRRLLGDKAAWQTTSWRCREYMEREYGEEQVLAAYLKTFETAAHPAAGSARIAVARHA
jgi:glycosyltransferase involved in cell wall biosynthesis